MAFGLVALWAVAAPAGADELLDKMQRDIEAKPPTVPDPYAAKPERRVAKCGEMGWWRVGGGQDIHRPSLDKRDTNALRACYGISIAPWNNYPDTDRGVVAFNSSPGGFSFVFEGVTAGGTVPAGAHRIFPVDQDSYNTIVLKGVFRLSGCWFPDQVNKVVDGMVCPVPAAGAGWGGGGQ